jgi:hypothetical protein
MYMNRRHFLYGCTTAAVVNNHWSRMAFGLNSSEPGNMTKLDESMAGQPVNLAPFGDLQSWVSPDQSPTVQEHLGLSGTAPLRLSDLNSKNSEFDFGVAWPEFRTIDRLVVRFVKADKCPQRGRQYVEFWDGITPLQGRWKSLEEETVLGIPLEIDGPIWTFKFSPRRTCKIRLRLQNETQVEVASFEVYGPSKWKTGDVYVEWGHQEQAKSYDGWLSMYNGALLGLRPVGNTQLKEGSNWTSNSNPKSPSGLIAKFLYTSGMDVDRTIATIRGPAFDFSFLPGEAIEHRPIDVADFGVYIRSNSLNLDRASYREKYGKSPRIIDAVTEDPEQTIEKAYQSIQSKRVTLSFVGIDSNSQKFGIAPDGHVVVANNDPSHGKQISAKFAIHFASTEESTLFQEPSTAEGLFTQEEEKLQQLEEGWLPLLTTKWSRDDVSFERLDYGALHQQPEPLDESALLGNELALLISQLTIRNNSPLTKTVRYYVKPWNPQGGHINYGPIPPNTQNAWVTFLQENCILVADGNAEYVVCTIDLHDRGALSLEASSNAVRYSIELDPGEEHRIYTIIPGRPLPRAERETLHNIPYDTIHRKSNKYWKDRSAEGMQVELPDLRVQNLYNATLQHFLLALTKDGKRGEHYANVAMLNYGAIGSESCPIIKSLEMRGFHKRAESCLRAWLSTQGNSMTSGDYISKEGGFFQFWPNYTIDQGCVLWSLAEHYLYSHDVQWLKEVAPQIVAGCDFIIKERKRTMKELPGNQKPLWYGLAPAGCVADMRDWEYSFMLNAYFYLGLKKSAQALQDADPENARRIASEAADYLQAIRRTLKECITISPVTRLRDGSSVPSVPSYVGLRGLSSDVKDSVDPDLRHAYAYDATIGPFHLLMGEVVAPDSPEATWMLNYLEDRFFMFTPLPSRVDLDNLSTDWFNLGGFEKLQPYYVHYQDAYLRRDQIPQFLRGFFNTVASISDPQTLTFQEELDFNGEQPHKTHEEGWFFQQLRNMLIMEMSEDLFLTKGTPRPWLEDGKKIVVTNAATYFGKLNYRIESFVNRGRIEAIVQPPDRQSPANFYLRLRHPKKTPIKRVTVNGQTWKDFDAGKEWIKLPIRAGEIKVTAYYS